MTKTEPQTIKAFGKPSGLPVKQLGLIVFAGFIIAGIGFCIEDAFLLGLAAYTCAFAIFALSVNIMLGGIGEVPLGQCVFFGIGSYIPAIAMQQGGYPFEVGILIGMAISAFLAIIIGWLTLRLTGAYFSIVSWGLSGVAMVAALNLEVTGGPLGIFGFTRLAIGPFDLSSPKAYFITSAIILLIVLVFLAHVRNSRFGNALESTRQSRHLAQSLGINVFRERLKALVLSAPIAALAGSLCIPYTQIVTPEVMSVIRTVDALLAALIGGTALLVGPVVGAIIFTIIPQLMHFDANVKILVFSLLIIFIIMVAPGGLHQLYKTAVARYRHSKKGRQ